VKQNRVLSAEPFIEGDVVGEWQTNFVRDSALPSWLSASGGTITHTGPDAGAGELEITAANERVRVNGPELDLSEFREIGIEIKARSGLSGDNGIGLRAADTSDTHGAIFFETTIRRLRVLDGGAESQKTPVFSWRASGDGVWHAGIRVQPGRDRAFLTMGDYRQPVDLLEGPMSEGTITPAFDVDTTIEGTTESLSLSAVQIQAIR